MAIPKNSALHGDSEGAYFCDSFSQSIHYQGQTALDVYLRLASEVLPWIEHLMQARNQLASRLGLKHLGRFRDVSLHAEEYRLGDKVGIFKLVSNEPHEVVLEDNDKHLKVRVSFMIELSASEPTQKSAVVHANTVVHVHNLFGKIYMGLVTPIHKIIVPSTLNSLTKAPTP